jgi:hypothetical protein
MDKLVRRVTVVQRSGETRTATLPMNIRKSTKTKRFKARLFYSRSSGLYGGF